MTIQLVIHTTRSAMNGPAFREDGHKQHTSAVQRHGGQQIKRAEYKTDTRQHVCAVPPRALTCPGSNQGKQKAGTRTEDGRYDFPTVGQRSTISQAKAGAF